MTHGIQCFYQIVFTYKELYDMNVLVIWCRESKRNAQSVWRGFRPGLRILISASRHFQHLDDLFSASSIFNATVYWFSFVSNELNFFALMVGMSDVTTKAILSCFIFLGWIWLPEVLLFHGRFLQDLEKVLDVFNITLARQQAQMEVNLTRFGLNPV